MWTLNNHKQQTNQALYKQVITLIEQAIDNGQLQAGERLPSERQLAALLKVNRSTIIHALDELADRNILVRKMGSGTYVNNQKWWLQSYPTINWQSPANPVSSQHKDAYALKANQLRRQAILDQTPIFDLANGDLPKDLLPTLALPEFSWQTLINHEQGNEAAHLGLKSFRQSVKKYLKNNLDLEVADEQILITSGAQQALFLIAMGLLKPGDTIGIEMPSYFYSLPIFQAAGLRIYGIPTDSEGITLEGLDRLVNQQSLKMIFLNPIFQNPTGFVMTKQRKKSVLSYCYTKRIPIVEDDAYSALSFNPQLDITPIKKLDNQQQVIYIGSLSKYIGKNIRAGWMIAPKAIINKLADIRQQVDSGLSVLPQLLAEHYLNNYSAEHQAHLRITFAQRASQLTHYLTTHYAPSLILQKPLGGFHLYAYNPNLSSAQFNELLKDLLEKHIIVAKGTEFGDTANKLRFSYGHFDMAVTSKK